MHLPKEISTAALERGAHALLTPPFTPTAVEAVIQSVGINIAHSVPVR